MIACLFERHAVLRVAFCPLQQLQIGCSEIVIVGKVVVVAVVVSVIVNEVSDDVTEQLTSRDSTVVSDVVEDVTVGVGALERGAVRVVVVERHCGVVVNQVNHP